MMNVSRRSALVYLFAALVAAKTRPTRGAVVSFRSDAAELLRAVRAGDLEAVERLLASAPELAATRDEVGRSAYVLARVAGHEDVAAALRAAGIDLDIVEAVLAADWSRMETLAAEDRSRANALHPIGGTPLYAAALVGSGSLWRLRGIGCDPDAAPDGGSGFTPARGAMECVSLTGARVSATDLLGNGADVNAVQRDGDSVLHGAVRRRSEVLVRLAVRKGAAVDARDRAGRSPVDLATELGWEAGRALLADHAAMPRDNRSSRFAYDANRAPVRRPDLSDVPREQQRRITGNSHNRLDVVRELVGDDDRLVFSISGDDELAIEASAHIGNRPIIRFHLDRGAPLSLPTAVALGDASFARLLLDEDPTLIHERGAHDFPVMYYAVFGGGSVEMAELLHEYGASPDQESQGTTALHWCARRDSRDLASWLLAHGADPDAVGHSDGVNGRTPLQVAREAGHDALVAILQRGGARG